MCRIYLLVLGILLLCSFWSCKKTREYGVITGEWRFNSAYMNHTSTNILDVVLPYHATNPENCYYQIIYENDGTVYGNYYTYDTLNYFVVGKWHLIKYDLVYLQLDQYVNGIFNVEDEGNGNLKLTSNSDSNTVEYLGSIKAYVEMNVHRE